MPTIGEQLFDNYLRWESRGRGLLAFDRPVSPAPAFFPFGGHKLEGSLPVDSRRPGWPSRLFDALRGASSNPPQARPLSEPAPSESPEHGFGKMNLPLTEFQIVLPEGLNLPVSAIEPLFAGMEHSQWPISMELVGSVEQSVFQFVTHEDDASAMAAQLASQVPGGSVLRTSGFLQDLWQCDGHSVVVEFGLRNSLPFSLGNLPADRLALIAAAMESLEEEETALLQIALAPAHPGWAEEIRKSVIGPDGRSYFNEREGWAEAVKAKLRRPLYGVVIRLASRSPDLQRAWDLLRLLAVGLRSHSDEYKNALFPLPNDGLDVADHEEDVVFRRCRRSGMLLNLDELTGFVHFPTAAVKASRFLRLRTSTRAAKRPSVREGISLGLNLHLHQREAVRISTQERLRHVHIIGATGSGKTTLLRHLITQDIESGTGFALFDCHGDLADEVLSLVPESRIDDVLIFDPSDEEFVVPFNILDAHSEVEKNLLASDLVAIFRAQSSSWGDQMNVVFGNAIRAFLASSQGGTLADLRRFLLDPKWRESFLQTVADEEMRFYWETGFPQLGGNRSIGPVLTRLESLLSPRPIRDLLSQRSSRLNFAEIMDEGRILIARIPQGLLGRENAHLISALLVAKLQQTAMSRQRMDQSARRPFFLYADEFQNFICPTMSEILSGARKYGLGLILAHQDLRQLERDREVAAAVLSNAFTRIVFRVGDSDAKSLAEGFAHFEARDLQNLKLGQAIGRVERADADFNLDIPFVSLPSPAQAKARRDEVARWSNYRVAVRRSELFPSPPPTDTVLFSANEPAKKLRTSEVIAEPSLESEIHPPSALLRGKGGQEHRATQQRLKALAEAHHLQAEVEAPVGPGRESVDLIIRRSGWRLACEISVSTPVGHELENARKCLPEDFALIVLISESLSHRSAMLRLIKEEFAPDDQQRLLCVSEAEFSAKLHTLLPKDIQPESVTRIKGRTVRRQFAPMSPQQQAATIAQAFKLLAAEMENPPS